MAERGSAIVLMPVGVLVVVILGSIAVDFSVLHLAQRELTTAAEAAVNDAVTFGLDQERLRAGDGYQLDGRRVRQAVERAVAAAGLDGLEIDIQVTGSTTVRVALRREVPLLLAPALPGSADMSTVSARATGTLQRSP